MSYPVPGQGAKGGLMVVIDHPNGSKRAESYHLAPQELSLLNTALAGYGIRNYYITYAWPFNSEELRIDKDKFNRDHVTHARLWLEAEVEKVKPKRILCLGSLAASATLKGIQSIKKIHGFSYTFEGIYTVCTYPPFMINKEPEYFRDFASEISKLIDRKQQYKAPTIAKVVCSTPGKLYAALKLLHSYEAISCDTETMFDPTPEIPVPPDPKKAGLDIATSTVETIGFAGFNLASKTVTAIIVDAHIIKDPDTIKIIRDFFRLYKGYFVFHNAKFDLQFIEKCFGVSMYDFHMRDTMLLNYLLDERPTNSSAAPHGLKTITRIRYDVPDYHFDFDGPTGWWNTPEEKRDYSVFYRYLTWDIGYTIVLYYDLLRDLATERGPEDYVNAMKLYDQLLIPGCIALAKLEKVGAVIDFPYFEALDKRYDARLTEIALECNKIVAEIYGVESTSINLASPAQVAIVLYAKLGLPPTKTRKGGDSTAAEVLEGLREMLPSLPMADDLKDLAADFLDKILEHRTIAKAQGTYVRGMVKQASGDGRLRTQYNQTGTSTGRLSAEKPALQTIPQATGKDIRRGFIAPSGWCFVKIDYSQLEYRSVAGQCNDQYMIQAFREGRDVHIEVASRALGIPRDEVTKHERYLAKFIGFGILYGRGAFSIANGPELRERGIIWTPKDAQKFIDDFLGEFPALKEWMKAQKEAVVTKQELRTPLGRIRRWPFLTQKTKSEAERQALNFPVQGVATDITLNALVEVTAICENYIAKPILIVHDEIDYLIPIDEMEELVPQLVDHMRNSRPLGYDPNCPLDVEPEWGTSWTDLYSWKRFTPEKAYRLLRMKGRT